MSTAEIKIKAGESPYGKLPIGMALSQLYLVKKHALADNPRELKKDCEDVIEIVSVYGVESLEINELKNVELIAGVKQVMINGKPELVFPREKVFSVEVTDTVESDKTIIGDKVIAYNATIAANRGNHLRLTSVIERLMQAESALKTTIDRQQKELDDLTRDNY